MITVHDRTATEFTATGLGVLDREISCFSHPHLEHS